MCRQFLDIFPPPTMADADSLQNAEIGWKLIYFRLFSAKFTDYLRPPSLYELVLWYKQRTLPQYVSLKRSSGLLLMKEILFTTYEEIFNNIKIQYRSTED